MNLALVKLVRKSKTSIFNQADDSSNNNKAAISPIFITIYQWNLILTLLQLKRRNSLFLYYHLPQTYNNNQDEEPCLPQMFKMGTSEESCTP